MNHIIKRMMRILMNSVELDGNWTRTVEICQHRNEKCEMNDQNDIGGGGGAIQIEKEMHLYFIDYAKTFEKLRQKDVFKLLGKQDRL